MIATIGIGLIFFVCLRFVNDLTYSRLVVEGKESPIMNLVLMKDIIKTFYYFKMIIILFVSNSFIIN